MVATVLGLMFRTGHFTFGSAIVVFLLANCAFAIVIDYLVFDGKVSGWQWAGIGLALISLVLLELGKEWVIPHKGM